MCAVVGQQCSVPPRALQPSGTIRKRCLRKTSSRRWWSELRRDTTKVPYIYNVYCIYICVYNYVYVFEKKHMPVWSAIASKKTTTRNVPRGTSHRKTIKNTSITSRSKYKREPTYPNWVLRDLRPAKIRTQRHLNEIAESDRLCTFRWGWWRCCF